MIKVLTWNVRSWYRDTKRDERNWKLRASAIRSLIEREGPDVILLQEALEPMTSKCIPAGYTKASGCSISHHVFVKDGFADIEGHSWHLHYAEVRLRTADARRFTIVSVHSTWKEKANKDTCEAIFKLSRNRQYALIAGGDWNNDPNLEREELYPLSVVSTDIATFQNWKTGKLAVLDFFALSEYAKADVRLALPSSFSMSDHLPVVLTL